MGLTSAGGTQVDCQPGTPAPAHTAGLPANPPVSVRSITARHPDLINITIGVEAMGTPATPMGHVSYLEQAHYKWAGPREGWAACGMAPAGQSQSHAPLIELPPTPRGFPQLPGFCLL